MRQVMGDCENCNALNCLLKVQEKILKLGNVDYSRMSDYEIDLVKEKIAKELCAAEEFERCAIDKLTEKKDDLDFTCKQVYFEKIKMENLHDSRIFGDVAFMPRGMGISNEKEQRKFIEALGRSELNTIGKFYEYVLRNSIKSAINKIGDKWSVEVKSLFFGNEWNLFGVKKTDFCKFIKRQMEDSDS